MLAVTTSGEILIAGALSVLEEGPSAAAEDRATEARYFAASRLARVPGMVAGVTELGPELAHGRRRLLAN